MVSHYDTEMTRLSLNRSIKEKLDARNPNYCYHKSESGSLFISLEAKFRHCTEKVQCIRHRLEPITIYHTYGPVQESYDYRCSYKRQNIVDI